MYRQKYYKYKNKYNSIKGGSINDPDIGDAKNTSILDPVSDDDLYSFSDRVPEKEMMRNINELILKRQNFQGFDDDRATTSMGEFMSEDLDQSTIDIGLYGKTRAKILDANEFEKTNFTKSLSRPAKTKILLIDNRNDFDTFTEKYGAINKKDKKLYIEWDRVAQKYRGFYLTSSALSDREDDIPYQGRTVSNWTTYDFSNIDEVIIFKKIRNPMISKSISRPFNGKVVDEFAIDENDFAKITDPITNDKILLIDNIKSFDKFTNQYGNLQEKSYIRIDWAKVKKDYDGLYIDKDNDFEKDRKTMAYYNDKLYVSWMKKENIDSGIVYLFE
ncbi:hypothetical protein QKU48_gp0945 [Fadolivirus algeromassiliense]|jgi:hypothetical protein|uniref:Uncharacterized protein n=1 Tax=Fadolivirus FV1/VV64 TaxID=3070911 RepID=A0A7D3QUT8_9VIRU|nr:hypothetical protein QKU48_gp0945 [Fadolivirus algeromassiliense]QKF94403.1 hypothetical protein Fadolivirus_1_945 [Fadolivirus FV1/VV64]